jgi:peroxiredoxin
MKLSDSRGKVVLLNFWATGCGGCVLEIPSFVEIAKTYKGTGFTAVGVSNDITYEGLKDADEAWARVRPFMKKYGINYTIAMGDDETIKAYALSTLPATFLIDKSGRVAVAYVGVVINKDNVAANIKSLLAEQQLRSKSSEPFEFAITRAAGSSRRGFAAGRGEGEFCASQRLDRTLGV